MSNHIFLVPLWPNVLYLINIMKKFLLPFLVALLFANVLLAENPKHEFRATWLTSVTNIDWPTRNTTAAQQQKDLINIFDKMVEGNMNAAYLQVRSMSDALYKSSYEPWSSALTGTRGKDPGYDPLAFAIEEAHKRGLELHVWVNPFRVTSSGTLSTSDKLWKNAGDWIIKYDNGSFSGQIIDPGYPDAREYVVEVLMEIINNYDVDGIVMDDYFYPYGGTTTEDATSKSLYKPSNVQDFNHDGKTDDDWRRANVDSCIKNLYDRIQAVKPWVRFGMGTFGIWTTQDNAADAYGITLPSGIVGLDDYDVQACNPVEWIKNGYVDYVNPQLYWPTTSSGQDYDVLCKWWAKDVCEHFSEQLSDNKKVHFCVSQAAYRVYDNTEGFSVSEIQKQIEANRNNLSSGYNGSVFYNTTSYLKMYQSLAQSHFTHKALMPPMDWKVTDSLAAPSDLTLSGTTLSWTHPSAERFTIYAYPKGMAWGVAKKKPVFLQQVVYGKSFNTSSLGSLTNTTIAVCAYDRFGVEHSVTLYNAAENENPNPAEEITWKLYGGQIATIEVPTNQQLWEKFKADFDEFYAKIYPEYEVKEYPINAVLELTWPKWAEEGFITEFITQHPDWIWLGEYIESIYGKIEETKIWRFNLYAFFNATNQVCYQSGQVIEWASCADFTTAGQPEAWGKAYQAFHGVIQLPDYVYEEFTLPTAEQISHPDGYPFLGWWDNAEYTGDSLIVIPAYWTGTLHAKWEGQTNTPVTNYPINTNQKIEIYDIFGRKIGNNTTGMHGIFIIKQGTNVTKIIK